MRGDPGPRSDAVVARRRLPLPKAVLRFASDETLVGQVRAGSGTAFEVVFDRHHGHLLAFCRQMLGSGVEAEDVVQDTFLAAYRGIERSDEPIVLRPWLYTIARHRCISVLRARREQPVDDVPERATSSLVADVAARDELRALLADVRRLPELQRAALVLAELGELSHDEIASVVGCPRQKVKALLFQARSNLAAARAARDTPCREIREHIAVPDGRGSGRALIRRHVAVCDGCREFRDQVRAQRRGFALLLPVAPSLGLKGAVLGAIGGAGGGASAVSGGALVGGSFAATSLVAVAIVGGAGHGGSAPDPGGRTARPADGRPALVRGDARHAESASSPSTRPSPPAAGGAPSSATPRPERAAAGDRAESGARTDESHGDAAPIVRPTTPAPQQQPADANSPAKANSPDRTGAGGGDGHDKEPAGDERDRPQPEARKDDGKARKRDDPKRTDEPPKPDNRQKPDKPESPQRAEKPDQTDSPKQGEKADKPESPQPAEKPDKTDSPKQGEKPDKPEHESDQALRSLPRTLGFKIFPT